MSESKTYEMQWDCKYCSTKKLLGKTHRFCPNCGAAQDPNARYFPADDEKVAVEDHVFVGTDKICGSCSTLNSGDAEFCQQCGAPLTNAAQAATLTNDQVIREGSGQQFLSTGSRDLEKERFDTEMQRVGVQQQKSGGRNWLLYGILGLVAVVIVGILVTVFWKQETSAYVTGHTWEREIQIEQYSAVSESAWCDAMPAGAYSITRRQEERSSRQVADGEECSMRRVDNGDGTFRESRECRTVYRSEPVYDDRCYFSLNLWVPSREVVASGEGLNEEPYWPQLQLARSGSCLGCEREGNRKASYTVHLREDDNIYTCTMGSNSMDQWQSMPVESTWKFKVGVLSGQADCSSLEPAG